MPPSQQENATSPDIHFCPVPPVLKPRDLFVPRLNRNRESVERERRSSVRNPVRLMDELSGTQPANAQAEVLAFRVAREVPERQPSLET
jgi:hypothetical protein